MQNVLRTIAVTTAAIAAFGCCGQARASLITNGTFTNAGQASLAGWASSGGVAATSESGFSSCCGGQNAGSNNLAQFGGGQTSGGMLSQSFATVIGQTYALTFFYGTFGDNEPQSLAISVGSLAGSVTDPTGSSNFANLFNSEAFTFTASAVTSTLTFRDTSASGSSADGLLENVSVSPNAVAVPEPASLALLGLGAASLYEARRRRKCFRQSNPAGH